MVSQIQYDTAKRLTAWVYYLLGVTDGMSASLETFKSLSPQPRPDAAWRITLRSELPPELAALRQPNGSTEAAARVIQQGFLQAVARTKRPATARLAYLEETVSLLPMKEAAKEHLPLGSRVRALIMEMDDSMPRWRALPQMEIIMKILHDELK